MEATLIRLEALLRDKRPDYLATFHPGASETEIAAAEAAVGFPIDEELKTLYRWRNGHPRDGVGCFQNYMTLMPIAQMQATQRALSSLLNAGEFHGMTNWWHARWLPFLEGPSGDYLCVDMAGTFGGRPGQLIDFVHNDPTRTIVAPNLASWLECYADLLAADLLDENGSVGGATEFVWVRELPGYPILHTCAVP